MRLFYLSGAPSPYLGFLTQFFLVVTVWTDTFLVVCPLFFFYHSFIGFLVRPLFSYLMRCVMAFRKSLSRKSSKSSFRRGATRIHKKNVLSAKPMRGGIRL